MVQFFKWVVENSHKIELFNLIDFLKVMKYVPLDKNVLEMYIEDNSSSPSSTSSSPSPPCIPLENVSFFFRAEIPFDLNSTLSFGITNNFTDDDLRKKLSFYSLEFSNWTEYIGTQAFLHTEKPRKIFSEENSVKILVFLGNVWASLMESEKEDIKKILSKIPCILSDIPKITGNQASYLSDFKMFKPSDTFFPTVKFPRDVPHVHEEIVQRIPPGTLKYLGIKEVSQKFKGKNSDKIPRKPLDLISRITFLVVGPNCARASSTHQRLKYGHCRDFDVFL